MNDPPSRMGALGPRGAACPADSASSLGRAGSRLRGMGRRAPLDAGTRDPAAAGNEDIGAGENLDYLSWVREKVLFLLHPERGLGHPGDRAREEVAGGEHLSQASGDDRAPERPAPLLLPRQKRMSSSRADAPSGDPPPDPAAPARSVLVRVVDHHVTREVEWTGWAEGCLTTRTEEHCITAVSFRTNQE